eukprot:5175611-Pyramimonas_sp.AAC.1
MVAVGLMPDGRGVDGEGRSRGAGYTYIPAVEEVKSPCSPHADVPAEAFGGVPCGATDRVRGVPKCAAFPVDWRAYQFQSWPRSRVQFRKHTHQL